MLIQCLLRLGSRSSNNAALCKSSQCTIPSAISKRCLSSTANTTTTSPSSQNTQHTTNTHRPQPQILDEHTLLSQLTPLKRIICLCPIPLGRSRIPWSGGDSNYPEDETINLNFHSQPYNMAKNLQQMQPLKVAKYRYGERFAIGVAVSDPYLSHAQPIRMGGSDEYEDDDAMKERFVSELVPTFRCDAHNLGSSPVFHTNLPYFRHDFLQHIGHFDIGAIVLALPMQSTANPFSRTPTKVQLEQEQKLQQIRKCLLGVLQNYVSVEDDEHVDEESMMDREDDDDSNSDARRLPSLGPLNLQGCIDHRLSITEVLSKSDNDCQYGSWDNISASLRDIQNVHTMGKQLPDGSGNSGAYLSNQQYVAHNVNSSVPPEIHAAVALNAMMDKYTSGYQSGLF